MRVIYLCNMKAPPTDKRRNTSGSQKTRLKIIGTSIEILSFKHESKGLKSKHITEPILIDDTTCYKKRQ